jgi:hypothetical protein
MNRLLPTCAALSVLLTHAPARAHHVVSESGVAWVEPVSVVEVEASAASFDHGGARRGRWSAVTPSLELALDERFSLMARAPVALILFDDGRGALGLGDVELSGKARLYADAHGRLIASAGLGVELPTGVVEDALGGGHVELSPFLAASSQLTSRFLLTGLLSARFSLPDPDGPRADDPPAPGERLAHGSVLAPHAPGELFARVGVSYVIEGVGYATVGADAVAPFVDPTRGPALARAELGVLPTDGVRVALGADATVFGEARHGARGRLSVAWMW